MDYSIDSLKENILTVSELSEIIRVPEKTIQQWAMRNRIPSIKLGSQRSFYWPEIKKWLKKNSKGMGSS